MLHVLTYLHTMWAIRNEGYVEERCGGRDGTSASVRSEERALFIEKECFALIGRPITALGKNFFLGGSDLLTFERLRHQNFSWGGLTF